MKEQKEPRAVIMQSWVELIEEIVPDEEQGRVYNYIFAEYLRIGYGVQHKMTKPDSACCKVAISFILPQVEKMCSKYAENEEKRMQRIEEIKAKKEAKAAAKAAAKEAAEIESKLNNMNNESTTDM